MALKRLIARKGRTSVISSDNVKTFAAASKWIGKIYKDEKMEEYLIKEQIEWKFNLSRAPWWGGEFQRIGGLVKQSLFKAIQRAHLTKQELEEILLDIEIVLNNRPLIYIEDDIQMPVLTPNLLFYGQSIMILEERLDEDILEIKRRQRYINKCKEATWKRWKKEYLGFVRERDNLMHNTKEMMIEVEDVVLSKGEEKNKGKWSIEIVEELYKGKDDVIRGVKLRTPKLDIERLIHCLYPFELHCDMEKSKCKSKDTGHKKGRCKRIQNTKNSSSYC